MSAVTGHVADRAGTVGSLWDRLIAFADGLGDADWRRPTPCAGWTVRDLLGHCSGLQIAFDGGSQPPPPQGWEPAPDAHPRDAWTDAGVAARRDWTPQQVLAELDDARSGHVARLTAVSDWSAETNGPIGRTSEDGLFQTRCYDLWVHLQDLRMALDQPVEHDDPSDAARVAHGYVLGLAGWLFVKKAGATEHDALRMRLGTPLHLDTVLEVSMGRGRFNETADAGDSVVEGSPAALTLLTSGRRDAQGWRADGLLDWSGHLGEAFVARARLF